MKKWDDLVEETMTPEAIARSDARAKTLIAQIHREAAAKEEVKLNGNRHFTGEKTAVSLQYP